MERRGKGTTVQHAAVGAVRQHLSRQQTLVLVLLLLSPLVTFAAVSRCVCPCGQYGTQVCVVVVVGAHVCVPTSAGF